MTAGAEVPRGPGIEHTLSLRTVTVSIYQRARTALGDAPEVRTVVDALETAAARRPNANPIVPGTIVHVIRAGRYGQFPALRLYYSVAGAAVHLLWIERYDEMEP